MFFLQIVAIFILVELLLGPVWTHFLHWPLVPHQLWSIYTAILIAGLLVYATSSEEKTKSFLAPLVNLLGKPENAMARTAVFIILPILLGWIAYAEVAPKYEAPFESRQAHPAPPLQFQFQGQNITLATLVNPYRQYQKTDPAKFNQDVMEGAVVYYQNCFFCHGDNLDGKGPFYQAFNPSPANFTDQGTITQLEESYVFWRVSTGGPGLPPEGKPWNSAMPVWQNMLTKDQIWKAILWIYQGSGSTPRTF
jgi:mono/diheme cytochrome c family protein